MRRIDVLAHPGFPHGFRPTSWNLLFLVGLLSGFLGCGGHDPARFAADIAESIAGGIDVDVLRIASTWPRSERDILAREFIDQTKGPVPVRLVWIELPPEKRLDKLASRALDADVLLGGPLTDYVRLFRCGRLESLDGPAGPYWFVARRQQIVLGPGMPESRGPVILDDPRVDPPTLIWAANRLQNDSWRDGYAELVQLFSRSIQSPGWQSGSALARATWSNGAQTLLLVPAHGSAAKGDRDPSVTFWSEGAAILRGSRHEAQARAFLRFLADHHGAEPGGESLDLDPDLSDLWADLIGATMVDAQEELLLAARGVARAGEAASARARAWLTEPPPWPPASIEKLQSRGGDGALALVQDLAGQIAPDPEQRLWLVQSWLLPARPIDRTMLSRLARAAGGRLVHEPRFRSWLRGEWTAWARQRFRRVARFVAGAGSSLAATAPGSALPRDPS
jgi:hypothetical protein